MWWFSKKHLPVAIGPYMPGCMDVMLGYKETDPFIRLYYPTNEEKESKDDPKRFIPWVPDTSYVEGISKVLMLHIYIMKIIFWWSEQIYIPAVYGAKVRSDEKLKCIVMSHGLGGNRFLYTNICCELASRGYLVASLEHRDSSACNTYYYANKEDAMKDKRTTIEFHHIKFGNNHYTERHEQLKKRSLECGKVLDFLVGLNKGSVPYNAMKDVEVQREIQFELNDLVGKLDCDSLTMMGHSFGAATALYTISKRKEFKQCVLLDPWMFPIKDETLEERIEQPLLFVNTQTFHIKSNVKAMAKFLDGNEHRLMYTIKHTTHENQTDSVLLIGYWLNWLMKKLDPVLALRINNALVLRFLSRYVGVPRDIEEDERFLVDQKHNFEIGLTTAWA